jgi:hypothetical protein
MKLVKIDRMSDIATFVITSGALRVTDPCYEPGTWCSGMLDNVLNGTWQAQVGKHLDSIDMESAQKWLKDLKDKQATMLAVAKTEKEKFLAEHLHVSDIRRIQENIANYKGRVAYLHVWHEGYHARTWSEELDGFPNYEEQTFDVGVDSGQAGFFDKALYDQRQPSGDDFYDAVCKLTLEAGDGFGTNEFGAVSMTGYGDGGYTCYVRRNDNGQIVAALIAYLEEYEEGEEEDDEEQEAA